MAESVERKTSFGLGVKSRKVIGLIDCLGDCVVDALAEDLSDEVSGQGASFNSTIAILLHLIKKGKICPCSPLVIHANNYVDMTALLRLASTDLLKILVFLY